MTKNVVFESEKLEKRQRLMRLLIPAAALILIILLAVIIAVIAGKNKARTQTGGEDTLYPYNWTENRDGSLTLRIPQPKAEGYAWKMTNSDEAVAAVSEEAKPPKEQTGYVVKPVAAGRTQMKLELTGTEESMRNAQIYSFTLILEVTEENNKLKTALISAGSRELPGTVSGGEAEGWPYQIVSEGNRITVYLKDKMYEADVQGEDSVIADITLPEGATIPPQETQAPVLVMHRWDCMSSNEEAVRVNGVSAQDGNVTVWLEQRGAAGEAAVTLRSENGGIELAFIVRIEANGSSRIETPALKQFEPAEETKYSGDELETVVSEP